MPEIKWTDKKRNEKVYRRIAQRRSHWSNIEKGRTRWIGLTLRHNGFVKNTIEGKIEEKVPRGRLSDNYKEILKKRVHCKKYQEVSQLALDARLGWRAEINQSSD
jgi:hypothetical protein